MSNSIRNAFRLSVTCAALTLALPATAEIDSGAYLAARQAGIDADYVKASEYFQSALIADPNNLTLMEQSITAYLGTGQGESAAAIARPFIAAGGESQVANIAIMAQAARIGDWDALFDLLEAGHEVGPLMDALSQAWAFLGKGDQTRAMTAFDDVIVTTGLRAFGYHHKAIALELVGDLAAADAIYSLPPNEGLPPSRTSVIAHLRVLCAMGDYERADDILTRAFGGVPDDEITALRAAIDTQSPSTLTPPVTSAGDGIAFAFGGLSKILQGEANESYLLLYAQAARYISPHNAEAQLAAARLLNALGQYDAAALTFAQVSTNNPAFHSAEMGRAESLRLAGKFDQAIEVLTQLTRSHPDLPLPYASLGDVYRQQEQYSQAKVAYTDAIEGYDNDASIQWWLHYSRGMTNERLDQWPEAEADFREALSRNPDNPAALNYLGYSLVDRGIKESYDEALQMIETAAAARPDSGAIIDSLGWVYYKLGRYQEAVAPLERAAELVPNDPILSDHLGDVYWMVGRDTEARFQWRRALSFNPEEAEAERIRRKLAIGLDAVYAEDGETPAPAIEMAHDN
ncbi:tetratricopeptide repeat protein [Octadecabacter sp. CECT 8868]|uniref:tetratricopeptide repeat protein n=1 Tax=Octadecabacter algicola TaxID=2909342 RepID=UPI001F3B508D|nr:tetratricopeptide repeat protein [Octadecabacter algicola]MCF2904709.1 tetratricopeptide repeat protein [Octadecabacter algicola]